MSKQELLKMIKGDMISLWYDDEDMIRHFGKTYKQIENLNVGEVEEISKKLHEMRETIKEQWDYIYGLPFNRI